MINCTKAGLWLPRTFLWGYPLKCAVKSSWKSSQIKLLCYFCRFDGPSTRLWDINVFTSVCHSVHVVRGRGLVCMPGPMFLLGCGYAGPHFPSTSHHKTYGWQAGGTHSTGILSCFVYVFLHFCASNCNPENSFHPSRSVLTTVSYSFSIQHIISQQRFFAIASCRKLSYNHTERQVERQAACQAARSHWNALWRSKMGPRSIPERHGKHQNFKAAAWRSVWLYPNSDVICLP